MESRCVDEAGQLAEHQRAAGVVRKIIAAVALFFRFLGKSAGE